MSRQLDQIIADTAARNLSFVQALETLTDLELESRNNRSIEPLPFVTAACATLYRQFQLQTP